MRSDQPNFRQFWDTFFEPMQRLPSPDVDPAWQRFLDRLSNEPDDLSAKESAIVFVQPRPRWPLRILLAAVLTILAVTIGIRQPRGVHAVVESNDSGLFRVSGGLTLRAGDRLDEGDMVSTGSGLGAVLALADGSRIEMRPQSTLSLERAIDGARIHLDTGGIIITAAKQRAGHLYVQTKDATVSVVGTVFLVSTEQAGSRVAVIQGEVQVQQGTVTEKLLPGQQVSTNPLLESHSVVEQLAWSREAETHLSTLQQPTPKKFEAASIRELQELEDQVYVACRGVDATFSLARNVTGTAMGTGGDAPVSVPLGRCIGSGRLGAYIATAFSVPLGRFSCADCPMWVFRMDAKAENPDATAAELREMLQALLTDRFKLKFHRYTEERPGNLLVVAKGGLKFKQASGEEEVPHRRMSTPPGFVLGAPDQFLVNVVEGKFGLKTFALFLSEASMANGSGPVLDRTGLSGIYDIRLTIHQSYSRSSGPRGAGGGSGELWNPPLSKALEDQLGLRLEPNNKVPVEYFAVDHIEKPSEN